MVHSAVPRSREHARVLVIQKMTVERPPARIVSIKCDTTTRIVNRTLPRGGEPAVDVLANFARFDGFPDV
jgi:hypothetical protein